MTFRVILTSSIMSHPLNQHVIKGIASAARHLSSELDIIPMSPQYVLEKDALKGADLLLFVGSLSDQKQPVEQMPRLARENGATSVFWSTEDPYERDFTWRANEYDHFISNDATSAAALLNRNQVHHLPLAGSFEQDFRILQPWSARSMDIFFCGASYQNRKIFIEDMYRAKQAHRHKLAMHLIGAGWESARELPAIKRDMSHSLLQDVYAKTRFVLYLHRSLNIANERLKLVSTTPGPRLFEAALAGVVQICEFTSFEVERYFDPKTEICLSYSGEEAYEIAFGLSEAQEAWQARALATQKRAIAEHCYEHRLLRLFEMTRPQNLDDSCLRDMARNCARITQHRLAQI